MSQTRNCIVCLSPACRWTGHVLHGNRRVLAGFCVYHMLSRSDRDGLLGNRACYGGWHAKYGDNFKRRKKPEPR